VPQAVKVGEVEIGEPVAVVVIDRSPRFDAGIVAEQGRPIRHIAHILAPKTGRGRDSALEDLPGQKAIARGVGEIGGEGKSFGEQAIAAEVVDALVPDGVGDPGGDLFIPGGIFTFEAHGRLGGRATTVDLLLVSPGAQESPAAS